MARRDPKGPGADQLCEAMAGRVLQTAGSPLSATDEPPAVLAGEDYVLPKRLRPHWPRRMIAWKWIAPLVSVALVLLCIVVGRFWVAPQLPHDQPLEVPPVAPEKPIRNQLAARPRPPQSVRVPRAAPAALPPGHAPATNPPPGFSSQEPVKPSRPIEPPVPPSAQRKASALPTIAALAGTVDAVWGTSVVQSSYQSLAPGKLELHSGLGKSLSAVGRASSSKVRPRSSFSRRLRHVWPTES